MSWDPYERETWCSDCSKWHDQDEACRFDNEDQREIRNERFKQSMEESI